MRNDAIPSPFLLLLSYCCPRGIRFLISSCKWNICGRGYSPPPAWIPVCTKLTNSLGREIDRQAAAETIIVCLLLFLSHTPTDEEVNCFHVQQCNTHCSMLVNYETLIQLQLINCCSAGCIPSSPSPVSVYLRFQSAAFRLLLPPFLWRIIHIESSVKFLCGCFLSVTYSGDNKLGDIPPPFICLICVTELSQHQLNSLLVKGVILIRRTNSENGTPQLKPFQKGESPR